MLFDDDVVGVVVVVVADDESKESFLTALDAADANRFMVQFKLTD